MKYYLFEQALHANPRTVVENESIFHYDALKLLKGEIRPNNLTFSGRKGFNKFDILETGHPALKLISSRMNNFLSAIEAKGWKSTKVIVEHRTTNVRYDYYLLQTSLEGPAFDYTKSSILSNVVGFVELKGRFFFELPSEELDFFIAKNTYMVFISHHVFEKLEQEKFSNLKLTPNDEYVGAIPIEVYNSPRSSN